MRVMIHNDKAEAILAPLRRRHPDADQRADDALVTYRARAGRGLQQRFPAPPPPGPQR